MHPIPPRLRVAGWLLPFLLGACAAPMSFEDAAAVDPPPALACHLPTHCVNSLGTGHLPPLHFSGTPEQAMARLRAALTTFPEAREVAHDALSLEMVFTTPVGFRDQVDFVIDPEAHRIDYRSQSLFGLYDFGKNASRMRDVIVRFEAATDG